MKSENVEESHLERTASWRLFSGGEGQEWNAPRQEPHDENWEAGHQGQRERRDRATTQPTGNWTHTRTSTRPRANTPPRPDFTRPKIVPEGGFWDNEHLFIRHVSSDRACFGRWVEVDPPYTEHSPKGIRPDNKQKNSKKKPATVPRSCPRTRKDGKGLGG